MQTEIAASLFRAYDIRGIVGETLTHEAVTAIAQAFAAEAGDRGQDRVVIARDGRRSGPDGVAALRARRFGRLLRSSSTSRVRNRGVGSPCSANLWRHPTDRQVRTGSSVPGRSGESDHRGDLAPSLEIVYLGALPGGASTRSAPPHLHPDRDDAPEPQTRPSGRRSRVIDPGRLR